MKHDALIAPDESQFAFTPKNLSGPTFASSEGAADFVTVPDAHLLFNGDFKRSGDDLKIIGDDGNAFVITDYFKHDKRPTLLSPEGAALTDAVVEALAGPLAPGQYAQAGAQPGAGQAIGRVEKVEGNATVVRNGVTITLNTGDVIMKGDVAQTGAGGSLAIVFADGTAFNLAANARMVLNDFVYSAGGGNNSALFSLVQGSISFVAGQVAKTGDMRVDTPVATMGIRGTAVLVEISANDGQTKFSVMVEPNGEVGSFNLYDKASGALLATVNSSNIGWVVTPVGPLQVLAQQVQKTPAELARELAIMQQVFQTFNSGPFDPNAPQQPPTDPNDPGRRGDNPQNTQTAGSGSSGGVTIDPIQLTATQTGTGNNQTNNNQNNNTNNTNNTDTNGTGIGDDTPGDGDTETTTFTANNIYGTSENDTIEGTAQNDFVYAGAGDDIIIAGHGGGNDFYDGDGDAGKGFAGEGFDTIRFDSANGVTFELFGIAELNKALSASTGLDDFINIERIVASPGNDVFNLHGGAWHIEAGEGDDVFNLYGAFESDLHGGDGVDTIFFVGDLDITEDTDGPDVASIEVIDLNTTGSNTVDIDIEGVLEMVEGNETGYLVIEGGGEFADKVNLSNEDGEYPGGAWRLGTEGEYSPDVAGDYTLYVFEIDGQVQASVYISGEITTEIDGSEPPTITVTGLEEILTEDEEGSAEALVTVSDPDSAVHYVLNDSWTPVAPSADLQLQQFNGHYYAFVWRQSGETWTDAHNAAQVMGGQLATVTSEDENAFILGLIDPYTTPNETAAFIGGSDASSEGLWSWSSGLEVIPYFWNEQTNAGSYGQYENWRTGEPNDDGNGEDYLAMEGDGTWNDVANNHAYAVGYVVEFANYRMEGQYGYAIFNTANGTITYHLDNSDPDTQALGQDEQAYDSFQISVNDGDTTVTEPVTFTIEGVNDAPEADEGEFYLNIPDQVTAGEEFSFSIGENAFKEIDAGDSLTFEAAQLVGEYYEYYETELPDWLSFDPVTSTFSGAPGTQDFGEYRILVRATDEHGAETSEIFTLTVDEAAPGNQSPVINTDALEVADPDEPLTEHDATVLGLFVSDADAGEEEIYSVTATAGHGTLTFGSNEFVDEDDENPEVLSFYGTLDDVNAAFTSGVIYSPIANENVYPSTDSVTLTVKDASGATDTLTFVFNVTGDSESALSGTQGKDLIFSSGGNDQMIGHGGADRFVFLPEQNGTGQDTITDFTQGQDKIALYDVYSDFSAMQEAGAFDTVNNRINLDPEGENWIAVNVRVDTLTQNDFIFHA